MLQRRRFLRHAAKGWHPAAGWGGPIAEGDDDDDGADARERAADGATGAVRPRGRGVGRRHGVVGLRDGRTALLAYTALDRLVDCCGDRQPWVLIET
ncbi:SAV_915 family protein [Aeromicrobium chenweiae]|uniref:SAV_915 family protein n=1 Tax=Aeromicrobium chenweiae TaxID=2079793 RepID=UPI003C7EB6CF